jgi:hypothetical protein
MKKVISLIFISIFLINLTSATQIWTHDEIKIGSFREKIDVYKELVNGEELVRTKVTDIFSFSIPKWMKEKDKEIFFVIMPPVNTFSEQTELISEVKSVGCGAGNANLNYSLDETFGLSCLKEELTNSMIQETSINRAPLLEFNASELNWNEFLGENGSKTAYISLSYILDGLVLETDESSNTLFIRNIKCYYQSPNCLDGKPMIYVSIPTYFSVNGGYNYQILEIEKNKKNMIFFQKDTNEDLVLSYRNTIKEQTERNKRDISIIFISLGFSVIFTLILSRKKQTKRTRNLWLLGSLALLIVSFILFYNLIGTLWNVILIIMFTSLFLFMGLAKASDELDIGKATIKRDFSEIFKIIEVNKIKTTALVLLPIAILIAYLLHSFFTILIIMILMILAIFMKTHKPK